MKRAALFAIVASATAGASPKLDFAYGILAGQRGDRAAEAAAMEKARAGDPLAFPLVTRVAEQRHAAGDLEGASTLYREFARDQPLRLEGQLAYADFLRSASPDDDFAAKIARDTLEAALKNFPGDLDVRSRLFRIYESLEQRDRSLAVFESLAGPDAGIRETLMAVDMARTLFPKDDAASRSRMDDFLERACGRSPENRLLARTASEHFRTTGRLPEAVGILADHVAAAPSSLELRTRLGILQLAAAREAENLSGVEGPAGDPVFLQEFAETLLESGQPRPAEERLRAAIRAFPAERKKETAGALRRLAGIWRQEKRNGEAAESLLQRADSLDPP